MRKKSERSPRRASNAVLLLMGAVNARGLHPSGGGRRSTVRDLQLRQIWELGAEIIEQLDASSDQSLGMLAALYPGIGFPFTADDLRAFRDGPDHIIMDERGDPFGWVDLGLILGACGCEAVDSRLRSNSIEIQTLSLDMKRALDTDFEEEDAFPVRLRVPYGELHSLGTGIARLWNRDDLNAHLSAWSESDIDGFLADPFYRPAEDNPWVSLGAGLDWRTFAESIRAATLRAHITDTAPALIKKVRNIINKLDAALHADSARIRVQRSAAGPADPTPPSLDEALRGVECEVAAKNLARAFKLPTKFYKHKLLEMVGNQDAGYQHWEDKPFGLTAKGMIVQLLAEGIVEAVQDSTRLQKVRVSGNKIAAKWKVRPWLDLTPEQFDEWLGQRAKTIAKRSIRESWGPKQEEGYGILLLNDGATWGRVDGVDALFNGFLGHHEGPNGEPELYDDDTPERTVINDLRARRLLEDLEQVTSEKDWELVEAGLDLAGSDGVLKLKEIAEKCDRTPEAVRKAFERVRNKAEAIVAQRGEASKPLKPPRAARPQDDYEHRRTEIRRPLNVTFFKTGGDNREGDNDPR